MLPSRNCVCLLVAPQWLQLFESCSLSSLSRSSSLAELASTAEENVGVGDGYTWLQKKANAFLPTAKLTWIIAWRCVGGRCCWASLCFPRGRLPALLPVSSGSCSFRSFFPMVIKVDQLALMMRIIHVGFLIKGLHKSHIHYFICAGKKQVRLQSFCWAESLCGYGRSSFRTVWGL